MSEWHLWLVFMCFGLYLAYKFDMVKEKLDELTKKIEPKPEPPTPQKDNRDYLDYIRGLLK
jgi:hypothetical protein